MSRLVYGWLTGLIASVPSWLGYSLASGLAELHFQLFPSRRHAALANLAIILPRATRREREQVVREMMRSYNFMLYEFLRLPHLTRQELLGNVSVVGREHMDDAVARGRGVVVCTCHLGNWELAAVVLAHWGLSVHAVAGTQLNRWLTPAVRETKSELAIHTVAPEDGFRKLLRALERNELVALMVDGDIYSHGTPVEFFGRETRFASGPGVLSQRTGAMILFGHCERTTRGKFQITLEPPLDPAAFPDTAALNAAVAGIAEKHIRAHVEQWCIFRPLWESRASADPAPAVDAQRVEA